MFNLHGHTKLAEWRRFRDELETSSNPLEQVAEYWAQAPFVNNYLSEDPSDWPDPWQLILDNELDDLAIALGMCYTIKLTQRFNQSKCEIHKTVDDKNRSRYFLIVDDHYVLNYDYRQVVGVEDLSKTPSDPLWSKQDAI